MRFPRFRRGVSEASVAAELDPRSPIKPCRSRRGWAILTVGQVVSLFLYGDARLALVPTFSGVLLCFFVCFCFVLVLALVFVVSEL